MYLRLGCLLLGRSLLLEYVEDVLGPMNENSRFASRGRSGLSFVVSSTSLVENQHKISMYHGTSCVKIPQKQMMCLDLETDDDSCHEYVASWKFCQE